MKTINTILTTFAQQHLVLGYNSTERDKINSSLTQLEKVLKDKLQSNIQEFIRFGSWTRNTILPRKYDSQSDIDLMVVFNTKNGIKTAGTYRKNLIDVVSNAYPNSISKKDFPVVKLELNHIMFDIVPAYKSESIWDCFTYYIPDTSDGWRGTKPNDINDTLAQKNQSYGNNIVRNVIRLCKHWNASNGRIFDSYEMEKWIVERYFYSGDDLYTNFLSIMSDLAQHHQHAGTKQALNWIKVYQGNWQRQVDVNKQFEWLQKLLPGLK
jgi:predicted nucleotidyltransferase